MHRIPRPNTLIHGLILLTLTSGCDERVVEVAREAADRQAQQNEAMAELSQEVAGGARQLIAADAETRKEIVAVHREFQAERARLDLGWTDLEQQRRQLANERRTESILIPVVKLAGGLLLVTALLGFSWYALFAVRSDSHVEADLNSFLVDELTSGRPSIVGADCLPQITGPTSALEHPPPESRRH